MNKPIPRAFFSCSNDYCSEETSYPADQIFWFESENRWLCECCWDQSDDAETPGISLADHIKTLDLKASEIL